MRDLTNQVFGRLAVVSRDMSKKDKVYWNCVCSCGNKKSIYYFSLISGKSTSCNCFKNELCGKRLTTHSLSKTREYSSWIAMKQRCRDKNQKHYHDYGGRGIVVCDRWIDSFKTFLLDMGPIPSDKHSLDRIKTDGNYEPGNCRWSTTGEQNLNRRNTLSLKVDGQTKPLLTWCKELGIAYSCALGRLKSGYEPHEVISKVPFKTGPKSRVFKVTP
jgi:hypothetical protein